MAVTSLWRIRGSVHKVILYAENKNKTVQGKNIETDKDTSKPENVLNIVIDYANRGEATEQKQFVSGINCSPENADTEMMNVKKSFRKLGGTIAYHGYQSFAEGEVDAETAHLIGCRLADELWGDRYQVVVATHLDKQSHIHNHFVLNTVSFIDGLKYNRTNKDYKAMQEASDRLCREYGLSVIESPQKPKQCYTEYKAEKNGEPTKNQIIKQDIDEAIAASVVPEQFYREMQRRGYSFDFSHKYATVSHLGFSKPRRLKTLGYDYTPERIEDRIYGHWKPERADYPEQDEVEILPEYFSDYQTVYVNFVLILGNVKGRRNENAELYRLLAEDLIKFDRRVEEQNLLLDNNLYSQEDIVNYANGCEQELTEINEARRLLRNELKRAVRADDLSEQNRIRDEIKACSGRMSKLRKDIKICGRLLEAEPQIEEKLHNAEKIYERNRIVNGKEKISSGKHRAERIR